MDSQLSFEQKSALAHSQYPQRPCCCELFVHSPAVIANFEDKAVALLTEPHFNLGRLGMPEDIAGVVAFLASERVG